MRQHVGAERCHPDTVIHHDRIGEHGRERHRDVLVRRPVGGVRASAAAAPAPPRARRLATLAASSPNSSSSSRQRSASVQGAVAPAAHPARRAPRAPRRSARTSGAARRCPRPGVPPARPQTRLELTRSGLQLAAARAAALRGARAALRLAHPRWRSSCASAARACPPPCRPSKASAASGR